MTFKLSQKTKTQLRAGIAMAAFGAAVTLIANAPYDIPRENTQPVSAATVQKAAVPR